jgi:hypothetical protein
MAQDGWATYPFEFQGGLVTNLSPLQQGTRLPGSARVLRNFEPSIEGGYRRIEGFSKYDDAYIPPYGMGMAQGSGQTGTTFVVANVFTSPAEGDTLTISGVSGTYTIAVGGVSYSSTNKVATLTLTASLDSSPADKAAVTFSNNTDTVEGLAYYNSKAIAFRNANVYSSTGSGWTQINVPDYGTPLVDGGSQTGTSLDVDGLTSTPQVGDTFSVAGIEKVYTITSAVTVSSGSATLTINPALASSPADSAVITFITVDRGGGNKHRFARYRFAGTEKILMVDGTNAPAYYDNTTFTVIDGAPANVIGAEHVAVFKNHVFYGKDDYLNFTAPYNEADFTPANGAGEVDVGSQITGLFVFRDQLIIFSREKIHRLVGNTVADFQLLPITDDIGCIETDTIQEVGGDVMFLAPDGLRLLSATERIGDFGLAVVSKPIQSEFDTFISLSTSFASVVIREKSQYRLLGFNANITAPSALGILGTQFAGQGGEGMSWAELRGIRAYVAYSAFTNGIETILFANTDGFVYQMEDGNSFDGSDIIATFSTPFVPLDDPRLRKTFYKLFLYTDPQGSVTTNVSLKLDFDTEGTIQPTAIELSNTTGTVGFYGQGTYGTTSYGNKLKKLFETQVIGSGFTVSLQFVSEGSDPPFSLDSAVLEYALHGRR